jgi:microcystin degradation protein MlrC
VCVRRRSRAPRLWRGEELLQGFGVARVEVSGFVSVLREAGVEVVPTLSAYAASGGPITRAAFDTLLGELVDRIARAAPLDGVLVALHGAMTVEDEPDAEGEIIERIRTVILPGMPLGASLDLHGHITPRMPQPDAFLIGYREYPHTDMFETGRRVAQLLLERLAGLVRPVMAPAKDDCQPGKGAHRRSAAERGGRRRASDGIGRQRRGG